jgi:hypothetical protein
MTLPPLTDQTPREDPTEGLRVLVADLLTLTGRLDLKERIPDLQATLKAAQERVCGPRALVMLLSEHAELKRRFLERLLGPDLALVPNPTTECTRLEYGVEAEQTVTIPPGRPAAMPLDPLESFLSGGTLNNATENIPDSIPENIPGNISENIPENIPETPRQAIETIRLPNPTLKGGLAVIDTPAVEGGEPSASVLGCIEQADAWIFVLNTDHALSEASQALLRRLPERGARLELVVENAEALSSEERMAARDRLMQTLREHCNIESPRLTLVASAATEGDEGSFWHGRFATFHSVMMLRGRERWLEGTLAMVLDALSRVGAEIDLELKSIALGVRHARLRLGMKDLDGLRARFHELSGGELSGGGRESEPAPNATPVSPQTADAVPQQSRLDWSGGSDPATQAEAAGGPSALELFAQSLAAMAPENADTEAPRPMPGADAAPHVTQESAAAKSPERERWAGEARSAMRENPAATGATVPAARVAEPRIPPASMTEPAFARVKEKRPKRVVSVHLTGSLRQLVPHSRTAEPGRFTLLKRIAWVALVIAFVCLILWALAPRGFLFGHEPPAEWDLQQPTPALASHAAPSAPSNTAADPPQPGNTGGLPETTDAATPNIPEAPLAKHHGAVRMPLVHPIPSHATAGVPAKRHHRRLLGLGKLWHWVRHPHHTRNDQAAQ